VSNQSSQSQLLISYSSAPSPFHYISSCHYHPKTHSRYFFFRPNNVKRDVLLSCALAGSLACSSKSRLLTPTSWSYLDLGVIVFRLSLPSVFSTSLILATDADEGIFSEDAVRLGGRDKLAGELMAEGEV